MQIYINNCITFIAPCGKIIPAAVKLVAINRLLALLLSFIRISTYGTLLFI